MKRLYYRGELRSCNYHCKYCPFANSFSRRDITNDSITLFRFCHRAIELGVEEVIFTPYGEAMIHTYYWDAMEVLSGLHRIGCQTNLSFDTESFVSQVGNFKEKIGLWCTFHPAQVSIEAFLKKCHYLWDNGIYISTGAVGIPQNLEILRELRLKLNKDIYFWINAKAGYSYNHSEHDAFLKIDPYFQDQFPKANSLLCTAGRTGLYVEADGSAYACHLSRVRLGNIYEELPSGSACKAKTCNCYLAYTHRQDMGKKSVRI
ncbi:MAG: STM4011 family radical SAM protein [Defluviitaleaceae bacterium]|nr:STM4011 family radical SAM protein [Defluviitaleaceae bacterium]